MIKHFSVAAIALLVLVIAGCKKNSTGDYTALFKNTVWTGEFNYTAKPVQPVSILFQDGGLVSWYEFAGEFTGAWKIENNQITVSFPNSKGFKAGISNDNKLTNIQNFAGNTWDILSAELNTTPDITIDNTTWQTQNLIVNFKTGNIVNMKLGAPPYTTYGDIAYSRKSNTIRYNYPNYKFFIVIVSASVMKGANQTTGDPAVYPFQIAKQ